MLGLTRGWSPECQRERDEILVSFGTRFSPCTCITTINSGSELTNQCIFRDIRRKGNMCHVRQCKSFPYIWLLVRSSRTQFFQSHSVKKLRSKSTVFSPDDDNRRGFVPQDIRVYKKIIQNEKQTSCDNG
jgi:hypothetical protein